MPTTHNNLFTAQNEFDIRCEWGMDGLECLMGNVDAVIIVDVLSFSTCVDIVVAGNALVFPYDGELENLEEFAMAHNAQIACRKRTLDSLSLSPASLTTIPADTRLVLPSLNGSRLSKRSQAPATFTACLRNARAVAHAVQSFASKICVIPAGEKWPNGNLRPAFEDMIGAGAVISNLEGKRSPEASVCQQAFLTYKSDLLQILSSCSSGKELLQQNFFEDVRLASACDSSATVPILKNNAYQSFL